MNLIENLKTKKWLKKFDMDLAEAFAACTSDIDIDDCVSNSKKIPDDGSKDDWLGSDDLFTDSEELGSDESDACFIPPSEDENNESDSSDIIPRISDFVSSQPSNSGRQTSTSGLKSSTYQQQSSSDPQTSTSNQQPSTSYLQLSTYDPGPSSTSDPQPSSTSDPQPSTSDPQPSSCISQNWQDEVTSTQQDLPSSGKQAGKEIQVISKKRGSRSTIDYGKVHCCCFCKKMCKKICRHLETHCSERAIATLPSLPSQTSSSFKKIKKERRLVFDKLRNLGDFQHNIDILQNNKGTLLVGRRPRLSGKTSWDDYLPCKYCLVFYTKSEIWRHARNCTFRNSPLRDYLGEDNSHRTFTKDCKLLLYGAGVEKETDDQLFWMHIVTSFQDDEISRSVKADSLLMKLGKVLFDKLGRERAGDIRSRLRLLARVKLQLMKKTNLNGSIEMFLNPKYFNDVVSSVKDVVGVADEMSLNGTIKFGKPSSALKIGQFIRKLCLVRNGMAIKEHDETTRENTSDFLALYEREWVDLIGSIARQSAAEAKFNKKEYLPLTEDLIKLKKYIDDQLNAHILLLKENEDPKCWRWVANLTLAKLILFNKRRGEEPAKVLTTSYINRPSWRNANQEILSTLNPLERSLMKKMDMVEVIGKRNRKVALLLPPLTREALDTMLATREDTENIFLFPRGNGHMRGGFSLRMVCKAADLKQPDLITSTKLRKYMATVSQVIGMSEIELQELARHMGHELVVHREFYRLQEDVTELAKISKLLLAVENGIAHKFNGLSLDDINMTDFDDVLEPELCRADMEDSGEDNATNLSSEDENMDSSISPPGHQAEKRKSSHIPTRKVNKLKIARTKWTDKEKSIIREKLFPIVKNTERPPKKSDIQALKDTVLGKRDWKAIKYQSWALFQHYQRKKKQMAEELL